MRPHVLLRTSSLQKISIDQKFEEDNHGLKFAIRPIKNFAIGRIEFPLGIIAEVNEHIDNVIIPANDSFADGLVGQLKNNERSAQLDFPFDDDVGKMFKQILDQCATTFLQSGYKRDATADATQCWVNCACNHVLNSLSVKDRIPTSPDKPK